MVGGEVIDVVRCLDRVWVNTIEPQRPNQPCAIYVERNEASERIQPGDALWWQGRYAMWTPAENRVPMGSRPDHRGGIDYDVRIPRVGYSGVSEPKPQGSAAAKEGR